MKKLLLIALPFVALFAAAWLFKTPDADPVMLKAKYESDASRYVGDGTGLTVHYRDEGNPDGPAIVLLHGSAASLHTWEPLRRLLENDYRIITYTQPGHGLTGPHPRDDYSYAGMAEALDLVTEELGLERFILGGNSMGGWISWRYALANPEKVEALLLLDAWGMPLREGEEEPPLNLAFRLLNTSAGRTIMQHYTPRSLVAKSARESVSVKSVMDEDAVDRYWELMRYPGNRKAAGLRAMVNREPGMANRVSEIEAPTLIIWGQEDQLIFASAAQTFNERLPDSEVVIYEGIGHIPMEEAPDQTAADIRRFLGKRLSE